MYHSVWGPKAQSRVVLQPIMRNPQIIFSLKIWASFLKLCRTLILQDVDRCFPPPPLKNDPLFCVGSWKYSVPCSLLEDPQYSGACECFTVKKHLHLHPEFLELTEPWNLPCLNGTSANILRDLYFKEYILAKCYFSILM